MQVTFFKRPNIGIVKSVYIKDFGEIFLASKT